MMDYPYNLERLEKRQLLERALTTLTLHHKASNKEYSNMLDHSGVILDREQNLLEELPYLPVQLFKLMDLVSVPSDEIVKVLTSSGTTGQSVSKIYLDKKTSVAQTKALVEVMKPILGSQRLPMVIIDTKGVLKNRASFSARGAGILGFSNFGRQHFYALNDDMTMDWNGLEQFIEKHKETTILLFGFTFMIWQHMYKEAVRQGRQLNFGDSVLIHGGGWKKLKDEAVLREVFNDALQIQFGIKRVHNYYGMVEQVGSIFVECQQGYFHTPNYADVIVRDRHTFEVLDYGTEGLLQVVSLLPESYPGHSLLTEDLGIIHGEDNCPCGWKGKYFHVNGRIPKAEVRGCSDTYAVNQGGE